MKESDIRVYYGAIPAISYERTAHAQPIYASRFNRFLTSEILRFDEKPAFLTHRQDALTESWLRTRFAIVPRGTE